MAQRRYWNFQDDDSTFDLNFRTLGLFQYGSYRGFDASLDATMVLKLIAGATAIEKRDEALAAIDYSVWHSRQGVVITEDATIELPINNGDAIFDRIDTIYGSHEYIPTIGGASAIYGVIEGTPSATPIATALTDLSRQVLLGYLYIPANTTALTDNNVVYTKERIPDFANDTTIVHDDTANTFTLNQVFTSTENILGAATVASNTLTFVDIGLNQYNVTVPIPTAGTYETINAVTPLISLPAGVVKEVKFYTDTKLVLTSPLVDRDYYIDENTAFSIRFETGGNKVLIQDEAHLGKVNKYQKQQISNFKGLGGILDGAGLATLTENANCYFLGNTGATNVLNGISASSNFQNTSDSGGMVAIMANGSDLTITAFDFTVPAGYKPIYTPNELDMQIKSNTVLYFVEDILYWRLVDVSTAYVDIVPNFILIGGTAPTLTQNSVTYRAKLQGTQCFIEFSADLDITGSPVDLQIDFPFGLSVKNALAGTLGIVKQGISYGVVAITAFGGNKLNIEGASISLGDGIYRFQACFEVDIL